LKVESRRNPTIRSAHRLSPDADLQGLLDRDRIDRSLLTVGSDARDVIAANELAIVGHVTVFTARGYALAIPRKRALTG
jgi:hypothetical protein